MNEVTRIMDDTREIRSLWWADRDESHVIVGEVGVTKIVPYEENGEHCMIPWFAVYAGDKITIRVPAGQVTVNYAD